MACPKHHAYRSEGCRRGTRSIIDQKVDAGYYSPISTGTGQHLVDAEDVEGVDANPQVERILAGGLGDVLVGTDAGGFEGFTRKLLVLVGNEMAAEGELVDRGTLAAKIEDTDLEEGQGELGRGNLDWE